MRYSKYSKSEINIFIENFKKCGIVEKAIIGTTISSDDAHTLIFRYNLLEFKRCRYCNTPNVLIDKKGRKLETCKDCYTLYKEEKNKRRVKTCLEQYGVESANQDIRAKQKTKETSLIKYGVESPNSSAIVKQHKIDSCLEKYGVTHPTKLLAVKNKIKETNLEKYGFESPSKSKIIKEK